MENNFLIKSAIYKTSAVAKTGFLTDLPEIAFVGRSNVGKSSLINFLTNQKSLARTSSTPGLTKMVNYFLVNNNTYFVDLPGYGYSKTGKKHQELWSDLIDDYLKLSKNLKCVFLLLDVRHEPSEQDLMMQKYLFYNNIPCKVILTKSDKIAKTKVINFANVIAKKLSLGIGNVLPVSIQDMAAKQKVLNAIGEMLDLNLEN